MSQHSIRNLSALIKRASDDGARYCRIKKFGRVTPKELAEKAHSEFAALLSWPQIFVFYQIGFREGYRLQLIEKERAPSIAGKPMRKPARRAR